MLQPKRWSGEVDNTNDGRRATLTFTSILLQAAQLIILVTVRLTFRLRSLLPGTHLWYVSRELAKFVIDIVQLAVSAFRVVECYDPRGGQAGDTTPTMPHDQLELSHIPPEP